MTIENTLFIDRVEARCGMTLKCPYLEHQYFDRSSNLCMTLHYIFLRYVPTVVAQNGYRLSRAIGLLFDYLKEHSRRTPPELQPSHYADISIEIMLGFQDYLQKNEEPVSNAEKLKSAMGAVAKQNGAIPLLLFPIIARAKPKKTEPLTDEAYSGLSRALIQHIDTLYEKLEFRKVVDASQAYDFGSGETLQKPATIRLWKADDARSLRTFHDAGYPMSLPLEELRSTITVEFISSYQHDCDTTIKALAHKYTQCANYKGVGLNFDQLLALYYPTAIDQAAIVMMLLLQSGWNKETVVGINADDFEHILTGSIDEGLAVIFSEKHRSQGLDKPYDAPKQITASSNRSDRYSIYSLILLARNLSQPLREILKKTS